MIKTKQSHVKPEWFTYFGSPDFGSLDMGRPFEIMDWDESSSEKNPIGEFFEIKQGPRKTYRVADYRRFIGNFDFWRNCRGMMNTPTFRSKF
ncbi:MAG: hypothetical protein V1659_02255, partial [Candidatus Woesearchaeota archaeon]